MFTRRLIALSAAVAVVASLVPAFAGSALAATPVGVDGVIGAEWGGVTPTFVDYTDGSSPGAHLVDFNVYVRADANFLYVAAQAIPAAGDQWDTASILSLGSSANIYLDTDVSGSSDLIILPLGTDNPGPDPGYCNAADTICNTSGFGPSGPKIYSAGVDGHPSTDPGGPIGGVREVAIPWTVLQTDPDGLGFPHAVCSVNVRTIQAFGYNYSGSQFGATRFGTVSQTGCGTPPASPTPFESIGGVTGTPRQNTPPPTATNGSSGGDSSPGFALLICFAFGALGVLALGTQRRALRR